MVAVFVGTALLAGIMAGGCASSPKQLPDRPPTLAIWPIEDLSLPGTTAPDLAELMTAKVMQTAETVDGLKLVERERLLSILQELSLGSSELADQATALRVGRLTGARQMLFGGYQVIAGLMRLDLRLVDVETSRVVNTAEEIVPAGDLTAWLEGAEAATRTLLIKP